jgi:hypothetical protein
VALLKANWGWRRTELLPVPLLVRTTLLPATWWFSAPPAVLCDERAWECARARHLQQVEDWLGGAGQRREVVAGADRTISCERTPR